MKKLLLLLLLLLSTSVQAEIVYQAPISGNSDGSFYLLSVNKETISTYGFIVYKGDKIIQPSYLVIPNDVCINSFGTIQEFVINSHNIINNNRSLFVDFRNKEQNVISGITAHICNK